MAPAYAAAPPQPRVRTIGGKPAKWTRGMTVVVGIWVVVAIVLVLMRTQMGYLVDYTIEEQAALDAVPFAPDARRRDDVSRGDAGRERAPGRGFAGVGRAWYVWSRPWEGRIYVWVEYDLGDGYWLYLGWWVEDGEVTADPGTERFLESALSADGEFEDPGLPEFLEQSL